MACRPTGHGTSCMGAVVGHRQRLVGAPTFAAPSGRTPAVILPLAPGLGLPFGCFAGGAFVAPNDRSTAVWPSAPPISPGAATPRSPAQGSSESTTIVNTDEPNIQYRAPRRYTAPLRSCTVIVEQSRSMSTKLLSTRCDTRSHVYEWIHRLEVRLMSRV